MGEEASCGLPNECCFMNLKKGAKVIGISFLILSVLFSILLIIYLSQDINDITSEIADDNVERKSKLDEHNQSARTVAGLMLALNIMYAIASILLIKGAANKSKNFLVPFLILTIVAIFVSLGFAVVHYEYGPFFAVLTISVALFYFFMCVLSLYKHIARERYDTD